MRIIELKQQLLRERPQATEAQLNQAIVDYADMIDIPNLIRMPHDFVDVVRYLDAVLNNET